MRKIILLSFILFVCTDVYSQRRRSARPYWSTHLMLSSSTFLSDLGGKDYYGSNDPTDIDFRKIRYAIGTGIQYNLPKGFSFGLDAFYTRVTADDAETNWDRRVRKLKVRTDIFETSFKIEYTIPENGGALRGFYANVGGGISFFQPMNESNGIWYKLRPLGTEGQLIDPNQEVYKKYSPVIPFGFGKKFYLRNGMMLAMDISLRKSFTDYLDDVSGKYADINAIDESSGPLAAYFSNPAAGDFHEGNPVGRTGVDRGESSNLDNYFLFGFKLQIPLNGGRGGNYNTSCSFSNSWIKSNGSLPKFKKRGKRKRIRIFR